MFPVTQSSFRLVSLPLLASLLLGLLPARAEPVSWMERYALSTDRESMLTELIPGSDEYYFYHCLFYQTVGKLERSEAYLAEWLASRNGRESSEIIAMTDRQRLLSYENAPQKSVDYLVRRLGIQLNHAPPATRHERRFPSELNASVLSADQLVKDALQRRDVIKVAGLRFLADRFLEEKTAGFNISLRDFLGRVDGAYIDRLGELVITELKSRPTNKQVFGDLKAHQFLTMKQLEQLAKEVPAIVADEKFVTARLRRLRPQGDLDADQQVSVRTDYLIRVESYLRKLPKSYAGMQASALYRLLQVNLQQGVYDRDLFERYLKIPRLSPLVNDELGRVVGPKARLSDDFTDRALLPAVGNEEPVVRAYLEHFLSNEPNAESFAKYLKPDYLRRVFAETKLLGGFGAEEQWYKMLGADQRQEIRDRVELKLSVENPQHFSDTEKTELLVDLKNLPELVVRTYQINTPSYYRHHTKLVNTDIDLDGLIATHEQKFQYNQPAVRRHREKIELPGISGRGVWIVDLVGKGLRARALIRRGRVSHVQSSDANGMVFTIIDENRKPIPAATMWLTSRQFIADDKGRITLPPVVSQEAKTAIISDGFIAAPLQFAHLQEQYELTAGMHLDRSLLQSGGETEVVIRPRLMLGNTPIAAETLTDVVVLIAARDLDGIMINHELKDLKLTQGEDLVIPIRVPARLASLEVTLSGSIARLADGKRQELAVSRAWDVAGIRQTHFTRDSFLTRRGDDYLIEVRGRNGEPVSGASVTVKFATTYRNSTVDQTFQADDNGQILLGKLEGVEAISYAVSGGQPTHQRDLHRDGVNWADEIHTTVTRGIVLPLPESVDNVASRYRLIEVRGGAYGVDQTNRLIAKNGLLSIRKLPAGDYHLIDLETARVVDIAVVDGPIIDSVAVGTIRHRQISLSQPLGIASIRRLPDGLRIQLSGETDLARVHLYASQYVEKESPLQDLKLPNLGLSGRNVYLPRSGYVSNLRLGDEYQYVLQRKYARKYSGVMLPQPGVLLNPWETEETTNVSQQAKKAEKMPAAADGIDSAERAAMQAKQADRSQAVASDYDFLADAGVILPNLIPDEDGVVFVANDLIKGMPILQIVACDPAVIVQRTITGEAKPVELLDLRLAESLDAELPFTFERAVLVAGPEQPLDLASLGSAQLQVYGSVPQLMDLYKTLVADPRLNEFDDLAKWHTLDNAAKLQSYSRLACHELHLFLWFHDHEFFDNVVKPFLANKKEKQFVDHWLLDADLSHYSTVWKYNQLNAAERVLLAMRYPEIRNTVQRELQEIAATQANNDALLRRGIESALKADQLGMHDSNSARGNGLYEAQQEMNLGGSLGGLGGMFGGRGVQRGRSQSEQKKQREQTDEAVDKLRRKRAVSPTKRYSGREGTALGRNAGFFRNLDTTKQWAEGQWDRVRTVGNLSPAELINVSPFWSDLAEMDLDDVTVSDNILRPVGGRHDALVALAMCGLPLAAGNIALPTDPEKSYLPEHQVAVVTKQLKRLEIDDESTEILIGQRFEKIGASGGKQNQQRSAALREFLVGIGYHGHIVVSNPSMEQQTVEIFWQVPEGSLPLGNNRFTDSRTITLQPFNVQAIDYQFYFPKAGKFSHYPATVAVDSKLLARGDSSEFNVVTEYSKDAEVTWQNIVANGDPKAIETFLSSANLRDIDWSLIAYRMKDPEVYKAVTAVLGREKINEPELWAYGFAHRDPLGMQTYLETRQDLCVRVGPVLDSSLLQVNPVERRMLELLEYSPLVRARIHRLGETNQILNPTFRSQYEQFVRALGFAHQISDEQQLVLAYYLLIQNRISEAIDTVDLVDPAKIATRLQYDYMSAYLAMHQNDYAAASEMASKHADHPVPRWQARFSQLLAQLRQRKSLSENQKLVGVDQPRDREPLVEGSGDLMVMDREVQQANAAEQQPEVVLRVEGGHLRIDHRMTKQVDVHFYGVDLELLFSKAPFVRSDLQRMAMVEPTRTETLKFDSANGVGQLKLDEGQQRQTLLIEAVSGASRSTALYYGGDLTTYVSQGFGQLQTTDSKMQQPVSSAYVKVYAKYPDGQVKFFKDGYTDARGRFDYASVSAADAQGASRFAILVLDEEKGATLHDVAAPNR